MTDTDSFDEPPDENEAFANLDESLDDEDGLRPGAGPEGERDLDSDLVVDQLELQEAGANLDDPDRIAVLDGGMDDPDGSGPPDRRDDEAGWDVDPVTHPLGPDVDPEADAVETDEDEDYSPVDLDLEEIPDDAPDLDGGG